MIIKIINEKNRYSIFKNCKISYEISETYMHRNVWRFSVVVILVKVPVHWYLITLCLLRGSTLKLVPFHIVLFNKILVKLLLIDVSIWMSLSAFVYACALIATVCINCRKECDCVCTSAYAYFSFRWWWWLK